MDNKPLKRNPNIVKLSKDHHAGLLFCWKIRQGVKYHIEKNRMVKYVKYFWEHHFSGHFKEEEEILFAPLKDKEVAKAIADHKMIKNYIDNVDKTNGKDAILLELADTVDKHIRYEERILFPHLQECLSDEQLQKIGEQLAEVPWIDDYKDDFWVKSSSL